ncbi:Coenzyme F420 hydrogenase/dehydrogenase, beta subunit C-terminal domain [Clostridium perfringens]|uniref:Coenzyme F420 hydrogenase/dehydrogenase, beta subunit C-terminal domain n=1 Tax=Clostridium perfringens TaxID=1502 RepID=UPI002204DFF3|nr:Coenzyme F420 hydrogenase/dehydrogenase, beta subunit C-terminal domain [Clostridium perfringens]ELC8425426.1 Coenzyme F420 hydrogenase/dehydrogenase, beta subunit C-terminal domain [Clostridium perfringens]ELC8426485.1 Coenzyme F420 hydrogenase/dehydrogenase, beta subunit C-terminal domain [Clostridium perfringens]MDK0762776.1 Coenzyme F420 hydrogenase/dehydrogenase, beta subunit C-terminal domain [Clostridium perfringens]MDM0958174.1 Coenzyme F420 hydrogenase/dehydrogenase, beta subunit C-
MIDFDFSKYCYSCSVCANVCGKNAIEFDENLHPIVNQKLCVNCGKCEKVCIKLNESKYEPYLNKNSIGWACKNRNENQRKESSSGGIFILLAEEILNSNGYICGCVYDDEFMPKHVVTNDRKIVEKMMGSKYVMSDMNNCIKEMKKILEKGNTVLFSGVPCQVAAVYSSLGSYSNLYTVSVVCHGSIERKYWQSYLKKEKERGEIIAISMRDKSRDWLDYGLKVRFSDGSEHITYRKKNGFFLKCFTDGVMDRDRCLSCMYKGTNIFADILLGDGWGVENIYPDMVDKYGISSVVCLSNKGKSLFEKLLDFVECRKMSIDDIVTRNKRIISIASENKCRKAFKRKYEENPEAINIICEKFAKDTLFKKIKRHLHI